MASDDWNDVQALFDRLVDLPPERQRVLLNETRDLSPETRERVEGLLKAHRKADALLEHVRYAEPGDLGRLLDPEIPTLESGRSIGSYEIVREIACGGMGTVYEAMQQNPRRRVALKVLNRDVTSPETRRRFEDEAAILARLHHPGIAQVLEAGTFELNSPIGTTAAPFFAMEYLEEGRHLHVYARDRALSIEERIDLLVPVCDAVHYGHLQGVVHRDLKPSNVLVDADGHPKIIDYGIAHWRARDRSEDAVHTLPGQVLGTLGYIAPEQLEGAPVSPATDVYSLGVLLYESLTGERPFDLESQSYSGAIELLRTRTPRRPSRLRPDLPYDLDWIVLRALQRDVRERYESAFALAEDLRRFRRGEPVHAAPPRVTYRIAKFVARHKVQVALTTLLILSSVTGSIVSTLGWSDAETQRRVAVQAAERARLESTRYRDLSRFLRDALVQGLPGMRAGGRSMDAVLEWISNEATRQFESEPDSERDLRATLTRLYRGLGLAIPCEREARRYLELIPERDAHPTAERLSMQIALGNALTEQGRFDEAQAELEAVMTGAASLGPTGESLERDALLAIGVMAYERRELPRAVETLHALIEREVSPSPTSDRDLVAHGTLGLALSLPGPLQDFEAAIATARAGFAKSERRFGREHFQTLVAARALANVLERSGQPGEALALLEPYLEFGRHLLDRSHPELIRLHDTISTCKTTLQRHAAPTEARTLLEEALAASDERYGPEDGRTLRALNNLVNHLLLLHDLDAVKPHLDRLIEDGTRALGEDDFRMLIAKRNLAKYHGMREEYERAHEVLVDVVAAYRAMDPVRHEDLLPALGQLADVQRSCQRNAETLATLEEAIELARGLRGESDTLTLRYRLEHARALYEVGRVSDAERRARSLLDEATREHDDDDELLGLAHGILGSLYVHEGQFETGEFHLLAADARDAENYPENHPRRLAYADLLTRVYRVTNQLRKLQEWHDRIERGSQRREE